MFKKLLLCLTVLFSVTACDQLGAQKEGVTEDAYSRMLREGKLRVGYIAYSPSFIIDPNTGKFSGISHDILQEVAKGLGVELEYVAEIGFGSMVEAIDSGRVDIVATAVWPTAVRGLRADFSAPLFFSVVRAYGRSGDERFSSDLRLVNSEKIKIATLDGEMSAIIAASDFPNATTVGLTQLSSVGQLALEVTSGKADVTFMEPAVAYEYMNKNPGTLAEISSQNLRAFPNSFMIRKGEFRLASTLNIAIGELHGSGFVSRTLDKYEAYSGSFIRVKLID